jgi:type I restriction enzyme M protein
MKTESSTIVQRLWNYCNVLRDDGISYGDYVEQLTYLLFLKMAEEKASLFSARTSAFTVPKGYDWKSLISQQDKYELEIHYSHILEALASEPGMLGVIFKESQNKIRDPLKLKRLIELIDGEKWTGMDIDVKGEIYEGILEKNAEDTKSGAGQYFTPRPLIKAIVAVLQPELGETICDPACGTGGFFLAARDYILSQGKNVENQLTPSQQLFLEKKTFWGWEIVDNTARLCVMNLFLHGIGGKESPITVGDSLDSDPSEHHDKVMTNPPFGKKSSITIVNSEGKSERESLTYQRPDFIVTTSNKQLNFLQHVKTLLKVTGKAAIVIPDNVLFEGGAGEIIRKSLLHDCNVHTLLRLPTGIFYAQGVKANVLFFDNRSSRNEPWTEKLWIYDLRTNMHFTLKTNQLKFEDLEDFIKCYSTEDINARIETERFHCFTYEKLIQRDKVNLDIFWLKDESFDDSENLPNPDIIAAEIVENLESALEQFSSIYQELERVE